ncbi:major facilitator superfamily transporter [Xylariomycetidae sp. FL2044]|nr:major facilitator superfamily transporter [Xylariomycetidae sp. FL2044]
MSEPSSKSAITKTTPLLSSGSPSSDDASSVKSHDSSSSTAGDRGTAVPVVLGAEGADVENGGIVGDRGATTTTGDAPKLGTASMIQIVAVLMIGLFTAGLDGSLVLATHPRIASEFNALEDSSWLFISFLLAGTSTQVLGPSNLFAPYEEYEFADVNSAIIGTSKAMWTVILGRIISGSGGSGLASLGLVMTSDLVPLRDVATWVGYINVCTTTGRSLGGPVGGWLADQVGWRWSFLGQTPLFVAAIISSGFVLPNTKAKTADGSELSARSRVARIDFIGAALLGLAVLLFMLPLEIGGARVPWSHPVIPGLFVAAFVVLCLFLANEAWFATDPVIPIRLLKQRDILASYFVMACIAGAQTALVYTVPLYFQVTTKSTNTMAGLHLVPAVIGNAIGGLVAGKLIRKTGRYKVVILAAALSASIAYTLLIIRWRGHTNWWESLYIAPGGFGAGMGISSIFVSLTAVIEAAHRAVVVSGLYLAMPVGMILGVASSSAVMLQVLQKSLDQRLLQLGVELEARAEIIAKAAADVDYVRKLKGPLHDAVVGAYVQGLRYSYGNVPDSINHLLGFCRSLLNFETLRPRATR